MEGRQVREERGELTGNLGAHHLKNYRPDFASMNGRKEIDRRWSSESSGGRWEYSRDMWAARGLEPQYTSEVNRQGPS